MLLTHFGYTEPWVSNTYRTQDFKLHMNKLKIYISLLHILSVRQEGNKKTQEGQEAMEQSLAVMDNCKTDVWCWWDREVVVVVVVVGWWWW